MFILFYINIITGEIKVEIDQGPGFKLAVSLLVITNVVWVGVTLRVKIVDLVRRGIRRCRNNDEEEQEEEDDDDDDDDDGNDDEGQQAVRVSTGGPWGWWRRRKQAKQEQTEMAVLVIVLIIFVKNVDLGH